MFPSYKDQSFQFKSWTGYYGNIILKWVNPDIKCGDIYDALRNLISFVQFRENEKHPWRSVTFNTPPRVFFTFWIVKIVANRAKRHIKILHFKIFEGRQIHVVVRMALIKTQILTEVSRRFRKFWRKIHLYHYYLMIVEKKRPNTK